MSGFDENLSAAATVGIRPREGASESRPSSTDGAAAARLVVNGRYEILRRLAVGGMGEIYLARQVGLAGAERLVTVKTLLPHLAARDESLNDFLDEARLASRLNHPGIVSIFEVGKWRGINFIAMEYVHGMSLSTAWSMASQKRVGIPLSAAAEICKSVATALDHAHRAKDAAGNQLSVVHRDVSPQNIMVRYDGFSKLLDFGIAKSLNRNSRTETGFIKGKVAYMAPEQLLGQPLGASSDQFALGVILWELSTGKRLFSGADPIAIIKTILRGKIPPPVSVRPGFPTDLNDVIMRMLAPSPEQRFAHCGEVARALLAHLQRATHGEDSVEHVRGFLVKLAGDEATAAVNLEAHPVEIQGLEPESVRCAFCQRESPVTAPFCAGCGHALHGEARTPPAALPEPTIRQSSSSLGSVSRTGTVKLNRTNIPIIGRDGELAGIRAIIAGAAQGRASSAVFVGPPGSGKTRVLEAIGGIAALEGHLVARTSGHPRSENIWCRVIEALSMGLTGKGEESVSGDRRDTVAAFAALPGIENDLEELCIPYLERDPPMDVGLLARLFNTYLGETKEKSATLIIDDVGWLRENERNALLELMARMRNSRFTVVAAGMPGIEAAFPGMRRIPLAPLTARDIHRYAELTVRGELPKSVRDLLERARGIPANVPLVIGALVRAGALVRSDKDWLVFPSALQQVTLDLLEEHVRTAVAALDERQGRTLRMLAGSARPMPRKVFAGIPEKDALEELIELGLVRENEIAGTYEVAGASVLTELWRKSEADAAHTVISERPAST
jgi:serine/threonine-protein kinase